MKKGYLRHGIKSYGPDMTGEGLMAMLSIPGYNWSFNKNTQK